MQLELLNEQGQAASKVDAPETVFVSMGDQRRRMHTGKLVTRKLQANDNCEH